jgi:hypothetical protein
LVANENVRVLKQVICPGFVGFRLEETEKTPSRALWELWETGRRAFCGGEFPKALVKMWETAFGFSTSSQRQQLPQAFFIFHSVCFSRKVQ